MIVSVAARIAHLQYHSVNQSGIFKVA